MQQLGCDPNVWKQMFKKIWEHIYEEEVTEDFNVETLEWEVTKVKDTSYFNEETLKRMVEFCNQANVSPEMRSEVVKVAAGMIEFPEPANFDSFESATDPEYSEIKISLSIQGWGYPQTFEVDGNRLEELTNVEDKLGAQTTIVAIEAYSGPIEDIQKIKLISDRLCQNPGELTWVDLDVADLRLSLVERDVIDAHISLLKANCKKWKIGELILDGNKDTWAALASIAATGHIFTLELEIFSSDDATWLGGVNQEDIRKVWEATYELVFSEGDTFHGGRLNNTEADWQRMMQFLGRDLE